MKIVIGKFNICFKISLLVMIILMIALKNLGQFFIIYVFMTVHEIIHMTIAKEYGGTLKGITFMPIGLCADIRGLEDMSLWQRITVISCPPLFNIAVGLLFINSFAGIANIAIGIFNLLPIYPLDGSKLLSCIGGYFWGSLRSHRYIANISLVLCYTLIMLGFLQLVLLSYNISLLLIAVYIIKESKKYEQTVAYSFYKTLTKKRKNRIMPVRNITASTNTDLKAVLYRLGMDYYCVVAVRDDNIVAEITEDTIKKFIEEYGINYKLVDILEKMFYHKI